MPKYIVLWEWEEAFDKFGFDDGDGMVFTGLVAKYIESLGYETHYDGGFHNTYFGSIKDKSGKELLSVMPNGDEIDIGYRDQESIYLSHWYKNLMNTLMMSMYKENNYGFTRTTLKFPEKLTILHNRTN